MQLPHHKNTQIITTHPLNATVNTYALDHANSILQSISSMFQLTHLTHLLHTNSLPDNLRFKLSF